MKNLILRFLINAIALVVTAFIIPNFQLTRNLGELIVVALVFGLVNALVRPIIKLLTLPINVMTLGLFTIVINALMLMLTAWITSGLTLGEGFISSFITALLASIVISIISMVLSWFLPDN